MLRRNRIGYQIFNLKIFLQKQFLNIYSALFSNRINVLDIFNMDDIFHMFVISQNTKILIESILNRKVSIFTKLLIIHKLRFINRRKKNDLTKNKRWTDFMSTCLSRHKIKIKIVLKRIVKIDNAQLEK